MFYDYFDATIKLNSDSQLSVDWVKNITSSIPNPLVDNHPEILQALLDEVKSEYSESGKQSAVKHILKKPRHRSEDSE